MEKYGNENSLEIIITHHHPENRPDYFVGVLSNEEWIVRACDPSHKRHTNETAKVEARARNTGALLVSHERSAIMLINKHENWFK